MSLADLIPVVLVTRKERERVGMAAARLRWQKRNRKHCTVYKRAWRAKKRAEGMCPT